MTSYRHIAAIAVAAFMVLTAASNAAAECPSVPENKVWGNVSSHAISRYVGTALDGDWPAYIQTWEKRAEKIRELVSRESILVFHETNLWLRGQELQKYARDIEDRIAATRCLADAANDDRVSGETLAGSALNGGS